MTEPPFPIQHGCRPRRWCGQCRANRDAGFPEAYKGNGTHPRERTGDLAVPAKSSTCPHLGQREPGSSRDLRECDKGLAAPIHGRSLVVCCNVVNEGEWQLGGKCGPSCSGYPTVQPLASAHVPTPKYVYRVPPYDPIRPSSKRAVCTVVVGESAERNHELTGHSHRAYAARNGADYIVLRGRTQDLPVLEKHRYGDVVSLYPQGTLCLDASDTFILPNTPSIWNEVPQGHIAMSPDWKYTENTGLVSWGAGQVRELCKINGVEPHPMAIATYFNSGVWFGRPDEARYWNPPPVGFNDHWCAEENWCRQQMYMMGLQVHELSNRWNYCWSNDRGLERIFDVQPWVVHLAGMDNPALPPEWRMTPAQTRTAMLRLMAYYASAA